jgi:phytoene dehydrogenase-like protein
MNTYDHVVVGSGISGLTMTLLLAMNGQRVLLLEKSPCIGGSLSRFTRNGIPYDTGFHFTGGFNEGGILSDILTFLGIRDLIEPVFLTRPGENQFIFEKQGKIFEHPSGTEHIIARFKEYFPGETTAIDRYFALVRSVCDRTPSLNIHDNVIAPPNLDEDFISLDDVLKDLTAEPLLQGLLSGYAMCYGVRPDEISFANHSRMVMNFYESVAFVKGGGDAFVAAFREKFKEFDVDVRTGTWITELADIHDHKVGRFVLNSGEEIAAGSCVFTIHPKEILKHFPEKTCSKAFASRIDSFESSAGFFSVFARLKPGSIDPNPDAAIVSLFPDENINNLMDPAYDGTPALVIIRSPSRGEGGEGEGICILEPSFAEQVAPWSGTRRGRRPQEYLAYKQERTEAIRAHLLSMFPAYRDVLEFVDAGSMLTYKDYLNSPDGSAYGIKQKLRQFNVVGKLPLHNLYAAGQSAILPGILGAMMSSLIVGRAVVGREQYGRLLERAVCN